MLRDEAAQDAQHNVFREEWQFHHEKTDQLHLYSNIYLYDVYTCFANKCAKCGFVLHHWQGQCTLHARACTAGQSLFLLPCGDP